MLEKIEIDKMKNKKFLIIALLLTALMTLAGCKEPAPLPGPGSSGPAAGKEVTENIGKEYSLSTMERYGQDKPSVLKGEQKSGYYYEVDGEKRAIVGLDLYALSGKDGDMDFIRHQLDAAKYANCNTVTVPMVWWNVEFVKDNYDFSELNTILKTVASYGFKIIVYWHGTNFAAIDMQFTPPYVMADESTYSRITGFTNNSMLCLSDPDTLEREKRAYAKTMEYISGKSYASQIMAVITTSELNYLGCTGNFGGYNVNLTQRCTCHHCDVAYANYPAATAGNVFMAKQFALYGKNLVLAGKEVFDIPTISQVAPYGMGTPWRYAENPVVLYETIDNPDHLCAPSVTNTSRFEYHRACMEEFAKLNPNYVLSQGTELRSTNVGGGNSNGECAPFVNLFDFGGQGAIYWDTGKGYLNSSITKNEQYITAFNKYYGLLKGMEYHIVRNKKNPDSLVYWSYETGIERNFTGKQLSGFDVSLSTLENGYRDYGVMIALADDDLIFGATNYSENAYEVAVNRAGGMNGFKAERGCFDARSGEWYPFDDAESVIAGGGMKFTVNQDSGDFRNVVYRVYKGTSVSDAARGKAALASNDASPNTALDGSLFTAWRANGNNETIQIDLGDYFNVEKLSLVYGGSVKKDYSVYGSKDNSVFTLLKRVEGEETEDAEREVAVSRARYVRIVFNTFGKELDVVSISVKGHPAAVRKPVYKYECPFPDDPANYAESKVNRDPIVTAASENIALGKKATAGNYHYAYPVQHVNDGGASFWISPSDENQWVKIDLGAEYDIAKYVIKFPGGTKIASDFAVYISNDDISWEEVDIVLGNTSLTAAYYLDVHARYVKLFIANPDTGTDYRDTRVTEFEIYAKQS